MIQKLLEMWLPAKWIPWLIAAGMLVWIGWQTNAVYGLIEQHYSESHKTVHYAKETCRAVHILANLNPAQCEEP